VDVKANILIRCPIGHALAKSLEKWTSNLRSYIARVASRSLCPEPVR
jgi:hypothetical protein